MQATSVHEYFHQAQNRTKVAGLTNILGLPDTLWLTEGTAQWFEDYLFDDIDSYIFTERNPLYVIMDVGFNSPHPENAFGTNKSAYSRFAMWKLIESKCSGFFLADILNGDFSHDTTGVQNLANRLTSAAWNCNFENGFGAENSNSLSSAILYY